ncbi:hypothetical protein HDF24_02635 [Mucilaginibacter sp. X4EP1]|jgi:hypothetical protein|uniref:DUF6200 domain-containing protein n=1 Tax=Mucilaginibacter sp. X4EP1 TaxID=2723092 RepID=UPI002166F2F6|nr:hypothetical protein [Mucilaginibacter sp. X4EP1]MCS3811916.1 ribosomal protein L22 [Mucilaginibacter sp. X4EP1]
MAETSLSQNVVYLGKKSKKQIKKYRKGYGSMYDEVQHVLAKANANAGENKGLLPMVIVHRKKNPKGLFSNLLKN